ncbi:MAG TPA: hypothetical protein PK092_06575 [Chitinophagaceae bacterium]|nr:hypothetical protein [Chitinophagaceae bacterium]
MRLIIITFLIVFHTFVNAQSVRLLFAERKYTDIIKEYGNKESDLDGEETYMLGYSYFHSGNDEKTIIALDKALKKGFDEPVVYFFKGIAFRYLDKIPEAMEAFDSACFRDNQNQEYACERAFTLYYIKKYDEAIAAYEEAKKLPNTYQAPWYMIPHILLLQKKDDEALMGFYNGLSNISKDNQFYSSSLMDIGMIQNRLKKNYGKAIEAYLQILKENGFDYAALEGLMYVSYKSGNKQKADSIFLILKKAFEEKKLQGNMMKYKRAKIAEFDIEGKEVFVYKSFIPPAKMIDIIYTGYVMSNGGEKMERIFQTEQTIQLTDNSPKHILCEVWTDGKGRSNYGVGWKNDDFTPDDFVALIKEVLTGKIKAAASTRLK